MLCLFSCELSRAGRFKYVSSEVYHLLNLCVLRSQDAPTNHGLIDCRPVITDRIEGKSLLFSFYVSVCPRHPANTYLICVSLTVYDVFALGWTLGKYRLLVCPHCLSEKLFLGFTAAKCLPRGNAFVKTSL